MEGSQVYIPDEKLAWVPGTVLRTEDGGKRVLVRLVHANATTIDDRWVDLRDESMPSELPLQNDDPLVHGSVNDMCTLNHLHEPAIVYNLRARFLQQRPYTYTGDIVVAVNPYAWLDGLYSKATQALYMGKDRRSSLPPHVYATSASAFTSMIQYDRHQSILVSGESGAGKTETVKILMEHLATMSTTTQGQSSNLAVVAKVLKSNPLLEAFGNAKTIRNDNSSRFGKFTQLQFDHEHQLVGAKCRHYLLEKSRVVTQSDPHERNYHIFYQLVASNDPRWNLLQNQPNQNQHATSFAYLQGDRSLSSSSFSLDATRYTATREALTTIGMPQLDQLALLDALAGILHVGQVSFTPRNSDDGSSNADMTSDAWTMTYTLLGLDPRSLATSLCNRTVKARLEVYVVPLSIDQAQMNRDAMAKEIYARLFGYLVQCVNESISNDNAMVTHIDLLDIFGFEAFATNRFEQFCINFANEKLQQKFTHDVFKTVQEEYEQEGLGWTYVQFKDNQDLLDLLEAPLGVISLLNEECIRPMGNDLTFCSKLTSTHDVHPRLDKQKARLSASHFALKHYAGTVMYCVDGFVETNKDALSTEVVSLLATSSNHLVSHVFQDVTTSSSAHRSSRRGSISSGFMGETVVSKFKTQLAGLMADIAATQVHYVRCIKPNAVKSSSAFDFRDVADQLRCAGVVEAIRISRAAFPNKLSHERFLHRFELLQNAKIKAANVVTVGAACAQLATALIGQPESPTSFVLGSLHIFFAAGVLEELETQRMDRMHSRATLLQRMVRGLLCRRWFLRQRTAAVLIQARFRQYTTTTKFQQTRRRVTRLQALWRGRASRRSLATRQFTLSVVLVQRNYRKYIAKKEYIKFRQAVILLQAQAKQRTQQAKFHAHKRELRAQQTMEMDIVALKTRLDEEKRRALDEHKQQGAMGISLLPTTKQILPPPPPPPSAGMFAAGLSVDDVSLLDESGRMLETLQREVQKWRDVHDRDISEMDQLKNENKRIKDAYTAAGASFAALNQHNKQQSKANLRLMSTHAALIKSQEEKMKKYQRQVADLKDELKLVKGSNGFAVGAASVQENVLQVLTDHHVHHDVQAKVRQVFEGSSSVHHAPQRRT
ncbi:hypothetical protein, variant 2 [Aphanomyces astaci]|nr:hypothetical protein, variant 2 [Aphanomyces astaci]ETV70586.1 hypothetical protein, variant 2 [Aphanomyces astaci]|eukprot:XP_009839967.1 hypothetical protein, variant 2 [Aphanomyces astaci]